ncbi:MAG: carboxypeptidase regulatory-like domain-containing protein [Armatimonadetes bacterium]|nr:carboxypeptidase regulatory-like domain-containing protein [Armatimonadota bacterium]
MRLFACVLGILLITCGSTRAAPSTTSTPGRVPVTGAHAESVSILGEVVRPGPQGTNETPADLDVHLLHLDTLYSIQGRTDEKGRFRFNNLKTGGLYYVVIVSRAQFQDGYKTTYEYMWDPLYQTYGWVPVQVPNIVNVLHSWHQAINPSEGGHFALLLNPANADPTFCPDLKPTYDPVSRTPFNSWRRAELVPVPQG